MFISIAANNAKTVNVRFDGNSIEVRQGLSVAAALLEAGIEQFRQTPVTNSSRGPFCMMGACFDCLLTIDGMANQQACMIAVCEGMLIERQSGLADLFTQSNSDNGNKDAGVK